MFQKSIKIQIRSLAGSLLFEYECVDNTVKKTVLEAIKQKADLRSANLRFADLSSANLRFADLSSADLRSANLRFADLSSADLHFADLHFADLSSANLHFADLSSADLRSADLSSAKNIPQHYINLCSRDILFIFQCLKKEVSFLKDKLLKGEIDGTQYKGDCACLIGTLANADGGVDKVCSLIPFYEKGLENYGEQWFYQIHKGDTPENSFFAKHVLTLIEDFIEDKKIIKSK